jgi:acetyl esterase/lipase
MREILGVLLVAGLGLSSQARTFEETPRLQNARARLPQAESRSDGRHAVAEAKAFTRGHPAHTGGAKAEAARPPEGGERYVYKTVGDVGLPLYVFSPAEHKADAKAPAIVFFFGGGWKSGNPSQFEAHCKDLASRGMVAITVEYRVSSRHRAKVEDCIEDAKSAMRWVRARAAELGVDPDRIAAAGGSAGGHLAACTAVIDDFNAASDPPHVSAKPNAMVLFNPALGLPPDDPRRHDPQGEGRTRGPFEKCTPLTYASRKQAPCIMFFGTADRLLEGANLYRKASVEAGNTCTLLTYEGQGHGFFNYGRSNGTYYNLTMKETDKFLVELGWLPRKTDRPFSGPTKTETN